MRGYTAGEKAVILNRSRAKVKNLSGEQEGEILRRLAPQNDTHRIGRVPFRLGTK